MKRLVLESAPLGFQWPTIDPFLFCVHHDDDYPAGDDAMGPAVSLAGRDLGQDFTVKDGFRMYHGEVVPGFPQHPHRGFETVTIARRGHIDHSDSLGAAARFGEGDVQWLTAGGGIVHSEMFPLRRRDARNPVELFQIWLNLPSADKMAPPHFSMLWSETIPRIESVDAEGRRAIVSVVAGALGDVAPPAPPPRSWAARPEADVAIWTVKLDAGAKVELPPARSPDALRLVYFFAGPRVQLGDQAHARHAALRVDASLPLPIEAEGGACELLVLQGVPIAEPVAQHGPFVMNTRAELQQAFADYQRTRFGGWPWPQNDPVHPREEGRFARRPNGAVERP